MRKINLLFVVCIVSLISCRQDTTQLAKNEFSKYYNGKEEVKASATFVTKNVWEAGVRYALKKYKII